MSLEKSHFIKFDVYNESFFVNNLKIPRTTFTIRITTNGIM